MRLIGLILLFTLAFTDVYAQELAPELPSKSNKGRIYFYYGWNRSWYTHSDIHLWGDNYDFTLDNMKATDRQTKVGIDPYLNPSTITLPQTDARIGYYITDKLDISIGVDHMKYVLVYNQNTAIDGYIHDDSPFAGDYHHDDFVNTYSFLKFEHTDGLNYINIEIHRNDDVWVWKHPKTSREWLRMKSIVGFGAGALLPKSNVRLWNKARHDDFHWAGFGFGGMLGLDLIVREHFFVRYEWKAGFIDLMDIRTSFDPSDRGSQHFFFAENSLLFGFTFNPFNGD